MEWSDYLQREEGSQTQDKDRLRVRLRLSKKTKGQKKTDCGWRPTKSLERQL